MAAVNVNRVTPPQAFVSSYAPRLRSHANSLLTPVQPQLAVPPVRTTKRGTTAINYAEEFDDDSIDDSDGPARRGTGLRTAQLQHHHSSLHTPAGHLRRDPLDPASAASAAAAAAAAAAADGDRQQQRELGRHVHAPVDLQGIWREWMGKPKRAWTDRQAHTQAVLPTTLVPVRIDLDVAPFRPEPALPTPNNAKDFGIDESLPAYKAPEPTPQYRLKDVFLWNLHEALITPDQFARTLVDDLDFPVARRQLMVAEIAAQIRQQLEEHASAALHPLFQPHEEVNAAPATASTAAAAHANDVHTPSAPAAAAAAAAVSRGQSSTPIRAGTPNLLQPPQTNGVRPSPAPTTPAANGSSTPALTVTAQPLPKDPSASSSSSSSSSSALNPPDTHRCVLTLSVNLQNRLYTDKFEWSLSHPPGFPEIFARQTCADLGLSGEWVPAVAHAIYEASLRLKKDMIDNGGTLAGVVGSGIDGWGVVDNEACEYHGTAEPALGVGAGWRFDEAALGMDWEPKIEVLSKEEIEKREGDRERQLRRARRETARFTTTYTAVQAHGVGAGDYFAGGLGSSQQGYGGAGEDERMGRGERSKKKRRFRSLSPVGRDTPDAAGFGGTTGQLTEGERQYWHCSHCKVWGSAIWGVRDGPAGPRTLCHNCGLLYERYNRLPPWNHDLFKVDKPPSARDAPQPAAHLQNPAGPSSSSSYQHSISSSSFINGLSAPRPLHPHHHNSHSSDLAAFSTPITSRSGVGVGVGGGGPATHDLNPSSHLYTGASALTGGGQGQISASTMADIVNYAEPGEDLDWTRITEPRERKRLQNIINGRKYRERRLAAEGHGGSGGNYPGAAGVGSFLSQGYGQRQSLAASAAAAVGTGGGGGR